jgi:putative radical SAM enzyme (TIGR03279 family)
MVEVSGVRENSIASELGIDTGDKIISINGKNIKDNIDYRIETAEPYFDLKIEKKSGKTKTFQVERVYNKKIGLKFNKIIFDRLKTCDNNCIFCFVNQQPGGLRKSLIKKDDDYRFSFLQGSFITLTNLKQKDWNKIIDNRLSPLYISVHTTNPKLRKKMMGNSESAKIMKHLQSLADNGIKFHTQIVVSPGINDGDELNRTINDLAKLYPAVQSLGVVPVGLTKYRENEYPLDSIDNKKANEILDLLNKWQTKFKKTFDNNWLYAADEFYLLAKKTIPTYEHYNDFPQIENGIGLIRVLWDEFEHNKDKIPDSVQPKTNFGIITSILGKKALNPLVEKLNNIQGLNIDIIPVKNDFFGHNVTVTGLLTGSDILHKLKSKETSLPDKIVIPAITVNDDDYFLDDLSLKEFCNQLVDKEIFLCNNVSDLLEVIKDGKSNCCNSWKTKCR